MTNVQSIRIGGASGYWGEADRGLPQLLERGECDYVVFDYLAEITMSILARAKAKDPALGYATDFVTAAVAPNLEAIARSGVKLLSNAGGINPQACAAALREVIREAGLELKVAAVTGDDLTARADEFADSREMFSASRFPDPDRIASINAYLGAFPIAAALAAGADIVVTGRCVDSALTLAACIHEFGWARDEWERLAAGSLAGHLIECGPQVCGGNFTDWEEVEATLVDVGYPIIVVERDGGMLVTKPPATGGVVSVATVAEQMLYEIGDPQAYLLPDVICDFSEVVLEQAGDDRVKVSGAKGYPAPASYKTSATFADGYRIQTLWYFIGERASAKARSFAFAALERARRKLGASNLGDYTETIIETVGDGGHYGAFSGAESVSREVALKIGARHTQPKALAILLKEASGLALAAPPGLALFTGGRPSPSPVVRLFSFLVPKEKVAIAIECDGQPIAYSEMPVNGELPAIARHAGPPQPQECGPLVSVPLRVLAWGRSGDKGDKANIGIIARRAEFAPFVWASVTPAAVAERFAHFLNGEVERFYLPGTQAINLLLHEVLGGGGMASLRADPQGKSYAQILLDMEIIVPTSLLEGLNW